jgi:hypothetical protein
VVVWSRLVSPAMVSAPLRRTMSARNRKERRAVVTRSDTTAAGWVAVVAAGFLAASLATGWGSPASTHPNAVLAWQAANAPLLRISSVLWLLAMLGLVVFAISLREALWATVADRSWVTVLFVQGAGVFATIAVVSAAIGWALADLAAAGTIGAELAGAIWSVQRALLRFATWGFIVPLLVVGAALWRHSTLGQLSTVAATFIAVGLLVPITWFAALHATAAWLLLAGIALLVSGRSRVRRPELVTPG